MKIFTPLRLALGMLLFGGATASADTQALLDAIFADKACTVLSANFQKMTPDQIKASDEYAALPSPLREMVLKVKSGDWSEPAGAAGLPAWNSSYALKYRVQSYEPFSEGNATAGMLSCKAHTNLNNPTGLSVEKGQKLYIMVEGPIKNDAVVFYGEIPGRLLIEDIGSVNSLPSVSESGQMLHEGLNEVTCSNDKGSPYIYYAVNTFDVATQSRKARLSDFPPLKIHIEGGYVNGFFNYVGDELYTPDTKADFDYTLARAVCPDYTFVGDAVINIYPADKGPGLTDTSGNEYPALRDVLDDTFDPVAMMKRWDEMVSMVRIASGLKGVNSLPSDSPLRQYFTDISDDAIAPVATDDYINNRLMNMFMPDQKGVAMWSTWWYNGMCAYSFRDVLYGWCDPSNTGILWGPTHEYGHSVQGPINLPSATEVSNNLYSNMGLFLMGNTTSRADFISSAVHYFNEKIAWPDPAQKGAGNYPNRIWSNTRMYFQLWLYYHQQKHNTRFMQRLNELLRINPPKGTGADFTNFYKQACIAAQEDLTDFFDAWSFLLPMDNLTIEDYGTFTLNLTPAEIAAAKAEVAAMNLPKNRAILFIDDRPGSDRPSHSAEWPKEKAGDFGGLADFAAGTKADGNYLYTIEPGQVNVKRGHGGVGFAIFGSDGRLLGFNNALAIPVNNEAMAAIIGKEARVYSVDADGSINPIEFDSRTEKSSLRAILRATLDRAASVLARTCAENDVPGYFYGEYTDGIRTLAQAAEAVLNDAASTAEDYGSAYIPLVKALDKLDSHPYARKPMMPGSTFALDNAGYPGLALAASGSDAVSAAYDAQDKAQQWVFENVKDEPDSDSNGYSYIIRNKATGAYITATPSNSQEVKLGDKPAEFYVVAKDNGTFVVTETANPFSSLHIDASGKVVSWWETDNTHSQWIMHEIETDAAALAASEMDRALYDLDATIDDAGTVTLVTEPVTLSPSRNFFTNAKYTLNGPDKFTSWNVLTDNDPSTYFHTDWSGADSEDGLDHYIGIDLRSGHEIDSFVFSYMNRGSGSLHSPKRIVVEAGNDRNALEPVTVIDDIKPVGNATVFTSDPILLSEPARILRFMVTANSSGSTAGGHPFFVISEFGLAIPSYTAVPSSRWPSVTSELLLDARKAGDAGREVKHSGDADVINRAIDNVRNARQALLDAMSDASGIGGVTVNPRPSEDGRSGMYDLQGRRLMNADRPGLYIINGRKTVVR